MMPFFARVARATASIFALVLVACDDMATTGSHPVTATVGPAVSIDIAPPILHLYQSATLTWTTNGAASCVGRINPTTGGGTWGGAVALSEPNGVSVTPTTLG